MSSIETACGIVAIVGRPNVGKSSLLNRLVLQKLAITSEKPQSSRRRVVGILAGPRRQAVLIDTPGVLKPDYLLHSAFEAEVAAALADADVVMHVSSAQRPQSLAQLLVDVPAAPQPGHIIEVVTKVDLVPPNPPLDAVPGSFLVSALTGTGIDELRTQILARLPIGPLLYPEEDVSSQSVRFFAAEFVREAAFERLREELPYSLHVEVEEYRESPKGHYIRAVAFVERDSQKGILLGNKGTMVREISRAARLKIEALVNAKVYLDLWVKVAPNWRRDPAALRRFGFSLPEPPVR